MRDIFVVQLEASPDGVTATPEGYAGAFINVYTTELNIRAALDIAEREVAEAGWRTERIVSAVLSNREDFQDEESGLEYYAQVLLDDIVVVIHPYVPEHTETDSLH